MILTDDKLADAILKEAKEKADIKYKTIVLAKENERTISELEIMCSEKRPDSKTIFIEMMKLTDRFLNQTA